MVVGVHRRAVGVLTHRLDAEHALYELRDSGSPIEKVAVVAQNANQNDGIVGTEVRERVGDKADEGATVGAISGGTLGGLAGLLVGLGSLVIPGIGPVMLAGATATALATTLAGAGIGAATGSLLGALIGLGIPEDQARGYNERVERGHYLVIVDGTDTEIAKAKAILLRWGIEEFGIYDYPNGKYETTDYVSTTPPTSAIPHQGVNLTKYAIGYFSTQESQNI